MRGGGDDVLLLPPPLAVGAFPASINDQENTAILYSILCQGVTNFVCLQQEYVPEGVPDEAWRSGQVTVVVVVVVVVVLSDVK